MCVCVCVCVHKSACTAVIMVNTLSLSSVNILCAQCEDGLINTDDRVVLEAVHSQFTDEQVLYVWTLNIVQDGSNIMLARKWSLVGTL